jgi:uncharacterized protein YdiU (UPF0061 family)
MKLNIDDTFNVELPADQNKEVSPRQVVEACYSFVTPRVPSKPTLLHASETVAEMLGISSDEINSPAFLKMVSGAEVLEGSNPYAMCYGGHQFGNWAGQLGDGRAINLAEVVHDNSRWAMQLKGSGETPYSRSADGLAVLRSSIREHLCSEAMFHLGVPTTRSLSLSLTGDEVLRDVMYNGNQAYEKGAVVCRVAPSFVRFGNFQIFASRGDTKNVKLLADYTIKHFFPKIEAGSANSYIEFFNAVVDQTLEMIVHWQRVGFVHGVMNTDNMSILGLTIDFGPYGWLEGYDEDWTPNTTDNQHRRYRYGNQGSVAVWNLYQLANALYTMVGESAPFEAALNRFKSQYTIAELDMMRSKLGLDSKLESDKFLITDLKDTLALTETDMTIFYRLLSDAKKAQDPEQILELLQEAFYTSSELTEDLKDRWMVWLQRYVDRLETEAATDETRKASMDAVNPKYVLRNYMAQLAIDAADDGDNGVISELYEMLKLPYDEQPEYSKWFAKRPEWARNRVGCSALSCSS